MKTPFCFIIVDDVIVDETKPSIDYSEFIQKIKDIAEDKGLKVTVKQVVVEENEESN